jgi:hypothetical protein
LPTPAAFAPASTAPLTAPVAAPMTAPLATLVKTSAAFAITPFDELFTVFFCAEELLDVDDLAVDFDADLEDLLDEAFEPESEDLFADDFEPEPIDLLAVDFEPELNDLLAEDLDAPPVDLPAVDLPAVDFPDEDDLLAAGFAAVFEPEDLFAKVDFGADVFPEADLLPLVEDDLLAVFLLPAVVDFAEFLFVVAIAISLKFFLQLTPEFLR